MSSTKLKRPDRDVSRQNKANSVVKATMLSGLCKDGLENLEKILMDINSIVEFTDVAVEIAPKYKQMMEIVDICKSTLRSSSRLYMKCSTYIK